VKCWVQIGLLFALSTASSTEQNLPDAFPVIQRTKYVVQYDASRRVPAWVYECLTPALLKGKNTRKGCTFKVDKELSVEHQARNRDYVKSGFDRGHMAPSSDYKSNAKLMKETFLLSNMCPQVPAMNRGVWKHLEKYIRTKTKTAQRVHVVTGPLFLPNEESQGHRYVRYEVIGDNCVSVPTHCFKAICVEQAEKDYELHAWIIPNSDRGIDKALDEYEVSMVELERLSGFQLY